VCSVSIFTVQEHYMRAMRAMQQSESEMGLSPKVVGWTCKQYLVVQIHYTYTYMLLFMQIRYGKTSSAVVV